jgi:hypothetical protein
MVSLHISLGLWRSGVISNLNVSVLCEIHISVPACYSLPINRRSLHEYAKRGKNVPLSYNSANILAHLIVFLNRLCLGYPPKNPQSLNCWSIHSANFIRLVYWRRHVIFANTIGLSHLE